MMRVSTYWQESRLQDIDWGLWLVIGLLLVLLGFIIGAIGAVWYGLYHIISNATATVDEHSMMVAIVAVLMAAAFMWAFQSQLKRIVRQLFGAAAVCVLLLGTHPLFVQTIGMSDLAAWGEYATREQTVRMLLCPILLFIFAVEWVAGLVGRIFHGR
jgi:hypothetical protein